MWLEVLALRPVTRQPAVLSLDGCLVRLQSRHVICGPIEPPSLQAAIPVGMLLPIGNKVG